MFRSVVCVACLVAVACATAVASPLIIDHNDVDITQLTTAQIARAKATLHIAYGHTSHGSQITDGMNGLVGFANGGGKGLSFPTDFFAWNNGGSGGALDLHDEAMGGDVGYYPAWYNNTLNYLNNAANTDVNVIIWSWCGQMDDEYADGTLSNMYLLPMTSLETSYPDVVFVYMTGHVPDTNSMSAALDNRTKAACQAIKDYCIANNKVFYDFNDIEHYNPDGTYFEFVTDGCDYYATNSGSSAGNWASEWQDSHTENVDWYDCGAAHSLPLNANQKAYAAWALWCAIAADLDRDDIDDTWEEAHGGTELFSGGSSNCDHDAMTDMEEFIADTDPDDSNSCFRINGLWDPASYSVSFLSSSNRRYTLETCDHLVTGSWLIVGTQSNVPGEGGSMMLTDTNDAAIQNYRLSVGLR